VVLPVTELTSMTSDNVGIQLDAAISLRIVDAGKAVTSLCTSGEDLSFSAAAMHATIMLKAKVGARCQPSRRRRWRNARAPSLALAHKCS